MSTFDSPAPYRTPCAACGQPRHPTGREAEIIRRYTAGESLRAVSEAVGYSTMGVWLVLKRFNVPRRSQGRRKR